MPTLNDCRLTALVGMFGAGHVNDLLLLWLQANGATSSNLNDAWYEMLVAHQIVTPFHRNDAWYELLGSLGYTGSLNDREHEFWCVGGGVLPPPPPDEDWITTDSGARLTNDAGTEFIVTDPIVSGGTMTVGTDGTRYGASVQHGFGSTVPADIQGQLIYNLASGTGSNQFYFALGVAGDEQLQNALTVEVTWGTHPTPILYTWQPASTEYRTDPEPALLAYIQGEVGNTIAMDMKIVTRF